VPAARHPRRLNNTALWRRSLVGVALPPLGAVWALLLCLGTLFTLIGRELFHASHPAQFGRAESA
jgi:hypothetical protein